MYSSENKNARTEAILKPRLIELTRPCVCVFECSGAKYRTQMPASIEKLFAISFYGPLP